MAIPLEGDDFKKGVSYSQTGAGSAIDHAPQSQEGDSNIVTMVRST